MLKNSSAHLVAQGADRFAAGDFAGGVESRLDAVASNLVGDFKNRRIHLEERHRALFFANFGGEFTLGSNDRLHRFASKIECGSELRFSELISSTFDHDNLFTISNINEIEIAIEALGLSRVDNKRPADTTDTDGTDRACEWNVGNTKRGRSSINREHIGIVLTIGTQEKSDDLGIIEITFWKKRTQWTIGHTCREDFLLRGATLTFEVSTGQFTNGSGFFFVFDSKREEILSLFDCGSGNGRDDDNGVTRADSDCTVC